MAKRRRRRDHGSDQGKIVEVSIEHIGNETIQSHAMGETVLYLNDTADFDENGGEVSIEGVVYAYKSRDDDTSTLTLSDGVSLTAAVPDETRVLLYPLAAEKWATVIVEDGEDPIVARVPASLETYVLDIIREQNEQESAIVALEGDEWVIQDIIGISKETATGSGAKILDDLDDVTVTAGTVTDRQHLSYDTASSQWKPYGPIVRHGTTEPETPFPAASHAWQFYIKHS